MKLWMNALIKYLCGLVMVALLLFLPAGSLAYPGAWFLMALLFGPMFLLGIVLLFKAPGLLGKRLSAREGETTQRRVVALSALGFVAGFIIAGLDFRFGWTKVPGGIRISAAALLVISYGMYALVMGQNAYLSRIVEVQEGQKVIDTGLYAIVRHPMYTATIALFLSMPLVLGSWIALAVFLHYPILIVLRIRNEEKVLSAGLAGYDAYMKKVKYRLIPFVW